MSASPCVYSMGAPLGKLGTLAKLDVKLRPGASALDSNEDEAKLTVAGAPNDRPVRFALWHMNMPLSGVLLLTMVEFGKASHVVISNVFLPPRFGEPAVRPLPTSPPPMLPLPCHVSWVCDG